MTSTTSGNGSGTPRTLQKAPTGIRGLDEITLGGLPRGRTTLVAGGPGCGKTLMGLEFLVHGALDHGEPGVLLAFEERREDLARNAATLGMDLQALERSDLLRVDSVRLARGETIETGPYDLDGLFLRLDHAVESIGARRVVLDTLEALFTGFRDEDALRAEILRLFNWLKERDLTALVTAESDVPGRTRHGLEEFVSDCLVLVDQRVHQQLTTRRLRVAKYRGSAHGTNEYPFLIDDQGLHVLPVTSIGLEHEVSDERISSGVAGLDAMLGGRGFYRGSSVLVSGTAGTGKSSIAAHFADATCRAGERCLYFGFEESPSQVMRNMRSIGLDLRRHVDSGLLRFHAVRPSLRGLEMHLAVMLRLIEEFDPQAVVVDPLTSMLLAGDPLDVRLALLRLVDGLKSRGVTALFTSLTEGGEALEATAIGVSSLMDTWLLLQDIETVGERNHGVYVLKSRGMSHSNQIREYRITDAGLEMVEVYLGNDGMLTGSARVAQEARDRQAEAERRREVERRRARLRRRRAALEARVARLREAIEDEERDLRLLDDEQRADVARRDAERRAMAGSRRVAEPAAASRAGQGSAPGDVEGPDG